MLDPDPTPSRSVETLDDLLGRLVPESAVSDFCRRAKVPESSLAAMRRGLQQRPKAWIVHNLAAALGLPFEHVRSAIHAARVERGR